MQGRKKYARGLDNSGNIGGIGMPGKAVDTGPTAACECRTFAVRAKL
jgi:hypothetical protein